MNLKNMHICIRHIHTPYLFILTVGEMCHLPQVLPNTSKATSAPWNEPNQQVFVHVFKSLIIAWFFCGIFFPTQVK